MPYDFQRQIFRLVFLIEFLKKKFTDNINNKNHFERTKLVKIISPPLRKPVDWIIRVDKSSYKINNYFDQSPYFKAPGVLSYGPIRSKNGPGLINSFDFFLLFLKLKNLQLIIKLMSIFNTV